jgi:hypothetical protein
VLSSSSSRAVTFGVVTFSVVVSVFKLAEMQLVVVLQVVAPLLTEQVVILQTGTTFGVTFSLSCLMDLTDEVALPVELVADTVTLAFNFC